MECVRNGLFGAAQLDFFLVMPLEKFRLIAK